MYEIEGFTYVVDKNFMEKVQPIKVDFHQYGFMVDCAIDFSAAGGCSSCSTAGSCCDS
ncbi:MAG: hypothetical protein PVI27_07985 [Desulfobacteraceae bacterium]